ncbi:DUF6282 family protein [Chloroflexota bacterium]
MIEDELLKGAIDLHAHCWPEFSLRIRSRVSDIEWAEMARNAGMRAIVMKGALYPSTERAHIVNEAVPGIKVFGGITLNSIVGGLNPFPVEITGELGGKVVWMPSWGARNDIVKGGLFTARMKRFVTSIDQVCGSPEQGITILDSQGRLLPVVGEILEIIKCYDMLLASSHLSIEESLILAGAAQKAGVKFVLTHTLNNRVDASIEQQKEIARMGGYLEHCYINTMPMHQRLEIKQIAESIKAVGPEYCIISTDANGSWNAPPPELMRMFIGSLLDLGIDEASIRMMAQENPAKLLSLPLHEEEEEEI